MKNKYIYLIIAIMVLFVSVNVYATNSISKYIQELRVVEDDPKDFIKKTPTPTPILLCCCKSSNPTNCTRRTACLNGEGIGTNCSSATPRPTASPTPKPAEVASVFGGGTKYIAADENAVFSFTASSNPEGASNFAPEWSISRETGVSSKTASGASYVFTTSGGAKGTGSNCTKTEYTITATAGGKSATATATVCKYCSAWKGPYKRNILSTTKRNTSKPEKGCYYYEGEEKISGGWRYTAYYTRCCSIPISDFGACYGNKPYLGLATDAGWQEKATTGRQYKYPNVKEEDCHTIDVNVCDAKPTSPMAITKNTDKCEDSREISYSDVTICSNKDDTTDSNFYTITCERKITTEFDYGDDNNTNTSRVLYKGQGFKYSINVSSIHTCTGVFNEKTWTSVYNKYLTKIKFVDSSLVKYVENYDYNGWTKAVNKLNASKEVKSEVFELWNILKGLRDLVINDYKNYKPDNKYDEQATIKLTYDVNGKSTIMEEQLISSEDDFIEGSYSKIEEGKKYNLTNQLTKVPEKFIITNKSNPRVVKLIPKRAYIDRYLGKGVNNDTTNIDGGNKIYIDYNIDSTKNGKTYPLSITLTGLGSNMSTVINNKCDIKVVEDEILYRSIDVSNPFINSSWEIGQNWLNDKYSFTNTIKSNTWGLSSLFNIELSSSDIVDIKESNNTFKEKYPYLGLCGRIDYNKQDAITKKICNVLKKAIDQFQ